MKHNEILTVVDIVSAEKGVDKELIFDAIETALATATKKLSREDISVRVAINRHTGDYETFRIWEVIGDEEIDTEGIVESRQISLEKAREHDPDIEVGGFIEEPTTSLEFGRIAAQHARHVITQKVRQAEREHVLQAYRDRIGEMFYGVVKRNERSGITLDMGNSIEAFIPRDQQIPRDPIRSQSRVRALLYAVDNDARDSEMLRLSRTAPELLIELFRIEVPEINEGLIEIVGAARDPGVRAKIAVKKIDQRVDPVGACVGMRGSRVQAVSNELAGERIDIIPWDENPVQFVINALSPAEIVSVMIDDDKHSMNIAVTEENLSQAIGRNGLNVRLASQLCGWTLNVMSEQQAEEKNEAEMNDLREMFRSQLGVDDEIANILVQEGFFSVEEIAYVPEKEMLEIEEFDPDLVAELRGRANDYLITRAIASEVKGDGQKFSEKLSDMKGMNPELMEKFSAHGIKTMEELADQSVDELMEIDGMDRQLASDLIMQARQPLFDKENSAYTQ